MTKLPRAEKEMEMAKAAYEQLNEQLSSELPQLIDLRVPRRSARTARAAS